MAKDIKEIIKNVHCILKLIVLVMVIIKIVLVIEYTHNITLERSLSIVCAYPLTILTIIIALLIALIFFESTRITEICLLIGCALLILDSMATYENFYGHHTYITVDNITYPGKNRYTIFMVLCIVEFVLVIFDILFHILNK